MMDLVTPDRYASYDRAVKNVTEQIQDFYERLHEGSSWNEEYREAKMRMQRRSSDYGSVYRTNTDAGECDLCGTCSTLICCDTCCECMGGDLIRCC